MTTRSTITEGRSLPDASLSTTIVEAVAEEAGVDQTALPPLYEQVDPDALHMLFEPSLRGVSRMQELRFTYTGYVVTVGFDGEPTVTVDEQSTG